MVESVPGCGFHQPGGDDAYASARFVDDPYSNEPLHTTLRTTGASRVMSQETASNCTAHNRAIAGSTRNPERPARLRRVRAEAGGRSRWRGQIHVELFKQ